MPSSYALHEAIVAYMDVTEQNGLGTQTDNNSHNTSTIANSVPMTLHRPKIETLNVYHHVHQASSTSSVDALSLYSSPGSSQLQSPSQFFGSHGKCPLLLLCHNLIKENDLAAPTSQYNNSKRTGRLIYDHLLCFIASELDL